MVLDELRSAYIVGHASAALAALALGSAIMLRRKGTLSHKTMGWVWAAIMAGVAISAIPIRGSHGIPNIYGFTPIHLFVVLVLVQLPRAVWAIHHGDVQTHGKAMRGIFFGGLIVAGLFTLLPNRLLGYLLWHNLLGVM